MKENKITKIKDFEKKLKEIDSRLEVVANPNREGISNVKILGKDICPVPSDEIKEKPDPDYYYTFPNGMVGRHNSQEEAIYKAKQVLEFIKREGEDAFIN